MCGVVYLERTREGVEHDGGDGFLQDWALLVCCVWRMEFDVDCLLGRVEGQRQLYDAVCGRLDELYRGGGGGDCGHVVVAWDVLLYISHATGFGSGDALCISYCW